MLDRYLHRYGLRLARFMYWLDGKIWSPAELGSRIYNWLERNHLCCDRHGYKGKE